MKGGEKMTKAIIIGGIRITETSIGNIDLTQIGEASLLDDEGKIDNTYLRQVSIPITNPIMNISHNFGYIPTVVVVDSLNKEWQGGVVEINENTVSLNLGNLSGKIILK
jgi:hypothetical protein